MQHNRAKVALRLRRAVQAGELARLEDGAERLGRGRPDGLLRAEAEVVERGAERDDDVARQRRLGVSGREGVALGECTVGSERAQLLGEAVGSGSLGLRADGHFVRTKPSTLASQRWHILAAGTRGGQDLDDLLEALLLSVARCPTGRERSLRLSSDLAFSVSFSIARELLDAASENGISEDELVSVVLILGAIAAALPQSIQLLITELRTRGMLKKRDGTTDKNMQGFLSFAQLLVNIVHRICASTSVQVLAANATAKGSLRSVRIASLLGVTVFFLFLSASSTFGEKKD